MTNVVLEVPRLEIFNSYNIVYFKLIGFWRDVQNSKYVLEMPKLEIVNLLQESQKETDGFLEW